MVQPIPRCALAPASSHTNRSFKSHKKLENAGIIRGRLIGREWHFSLPDGGNLAIPSKTPASPSIPNALKDGMTPAEFEEFARIHMGKYYGVSFSKRRIGSVPKLWDHVSQNDDIVGDAKYLTLVGGTGKPPAKFSIIAEHVWLLEKTTAEERFLVFGNDIRVPQDWLRQYGKLVRDVKFYFLEHNGEVRILNGS